MLKDPQTDLESWRQFAVLVSWGLYDRYTGIGPERLLCLQRSNEIKSLPISWVRARAPR